jgi:Ca2+/Na+ antiporter
MTEVLFGLVIAYVFLLALLMLMLLYTRWPWLIKAVMVLLVCGFYLFSYKVWRQAQGWPSTAALPERFLLHASVIEEPDQRKGSQGQIFVWASDLVDHRPAAEPRAYRLPYDKAVHSALEDAMQNLRNGTVQLGRAREVTDDPEQARDLTRFGERRLQLKFSALPDPALSEK